MSKNDKWMKSLMEKCALCCFFLNMYIKIHRSKNVNSVQIFCSFVCQISCSNFCVDRKFQAAAHILLYYIYFILHSYQIPLNFLFNFPLISYHSYLWVYCCGLVHALRKLCEDKFLWFGKKWESVSDKLHSVLYNYTVTFTSYTKGISWIILCTPNSSKHGTFFRL